MTPPPVQHVAPVNPPPRLPMGTGPIDADPRVLRAMSAALVGQYDPSMTTYMNETMALYRQVFRTDDEATVLVDGTSRAGIEAAMVSLLEPGDRVLVPVFGRFGHRLTQRSPSGAGPRCTSSVPSEARSSSPSRSRRPSVAGLDIKGSIDVGKDAGLVLYEPGRRIAADGSLLAHRNKLSAYAGRWLSGSVSRSVVRGRTVFDGEHVDELRRVLISGAAPPGSALPLDDLANAFGVSRIPVREALKTLTGEGLVEHEPRGGYTVARLTLADFSELYLVRGALESAALAAAAPRATPEHHDRARAVHAGQDRALAAGATATYHRGSRTFHLALAEPSGMRRLLHMVESTWTSPSPHSR